MINEIIKFRSTYASLGVRDIQNEKLEQMMSEAPAAINFTGFGRNKLFDFRNHVSDHYSVLLTAGFNLHVELFNPKTRHYR